MFSDFHKVALPPTVRSGNGTARAEKICGSYSTKTRVPHPKTPVRYRVGKFPSGNALQQKVYRPRITTGNQATTSLIPSGYQTSDTSHSARRAFPRIQPPVRVGHERLHRSHMARVLRYQAARPENSCPLRRIWGPPPPWSCGIMRLGVRE